MTTQKPEVSNTGRYSIQEASRLLGITRGTIYKYIRSGDIKCGVRKHNLRMFITGQEIERFWKAYL